MLRRVNELAGITPPSQPEPSIAPNDSEPLFLAPWEAKIFAMIVSLNRQGHFSWAQWVEFFKIEIETANADRRPTHGAAYFLLWLSAAEKLLVSKGLLLADEYAHTKSAFALEHPHPSIAGLMQEHVVINQGLDAFARFVERLNRHDGTPAELLGIVEFFAGFVESIHHGKEEDLLFQAMLDGGFAEDGPLAVMHDEHAQGGRYLAELRALADGEWGESMADNAAQTAQRYIRLVRQHVKKEDGEVYPSAHAHLSEDVLTELDRACSDYDAAHANERARLLALAEDLKLL